jgi:hypothetical protein
VTGQVTGRGLRDTEKRSIHNNRGCPGGGVPVDIPHSGQSGFVVSTVLICRTLTKWVVGGGHRGPVATEGGLGSDEVTRLVMLVARRKVSIKPGSDFLPFRTFRARNEPLDGPDGFARSYRADAVR